MVSCDKAVGELKNGDVLIDGGRIAAVGVDLPVTDADVIDATNKLVLPGLIDTHRHTWETQLRSMIPEGDFFVYLKVILQTVAPRYRPDDVYIGNLFGSLGAINSGITTMLDWSHIMLTPEHADAAVKGLADSGIRGVFAHGDPVAPFADWWSPKSELRHPADARRVRKQYFNSDEGLLTMALALRGPEYSSWDASVDDLKLARDLGVPITIHMGVPGAKPGAVKALYEAKLLGPDITHVHTLRCSEEELQMIGDSGGTVSTSSATEIMSGHGFPSLQRWLRHGIRPAISIDNETRMPTDLFTQMRALIDDRSAVGDAAGDQGGRQADPDAGARHSRTCHHRRRAHARARAQDRLAHARQTRRHHHDQSRRSQRHAGQRRGVVGGDDLQCRAM